jgi:hypothetical protein
MASRKQRAATRKNIAKAAVAAKRKRTISHLPTKDADRFGKGRRKSGKAKTKGSPRVVQSNDSA